MDGWMDGWKGRRMTGGRVWIDGRMDGSKGWLEGEFG